jgi:hypothetical protein
MGSPIELRETMFGTGDKFYTNDALNVIAFGLSNNRRDRQTLSRQLLRLCSRNWWRGPKDQAKTRIFCRSMVGHGYSLAAIGGNLVQENQSANGPLPFTAHPGSPMSE